MLTTFPKHIVILGGGTAGWLSAAYLDRTYNTAARRVVTITVIESPIVGRIGVGEATIPSLKEAMRYLGVAETDLIAKTNATLKHGIFFEDWSGKGETYFHPFEAFTNGGSSLPGQWLSRRLKGVAGRFADEAGLQARLAEAGYSPKRMLDDDYIGPFPYAYHLDAELLADFLRDLACDRGCIHVKARASEIELASDGDVQAVVLECGNRIAGDFFVDCSGFSRLIIGQTLKVPYVDFSSYLLCDRAVAIQAPYRGEPVIPPMTRSKALDAGWMWRIGLRSREGTGYVYSSAYATPQEAEATLRREAGLPADFPARHLDMRVGRSDKSWVGNCVAIGLSSGFIEPLESTGIYFVTQALEYLVRYFPLNGVNPSARAIFNDEITRRYEEIRDFIVAHYCLSQRNDTPFWREVRRADRIPPTLQAKLELWKDRIPSREDIPFGGALFHSTNWQYILYGMNWAQPQVMENAAFWLAADDSHITAIQTAFENASLDLPRHEVWLGGVLESAS